MKNFLVLFFSLFLFFQDAQASLYIDPSIGITLSGELEDTDFDNSPVTIGSRLGYSSLGLIFGLSYFQTAGIDFENNSADYDMTEIGVFAGYEFPILVRAWAAYMLSGDLESGGTKYEDLSGLKLGFGYTGLPFLSINFEMKQYEFGELNGADVERDFNAYVLSVSLPWSF
jgi:hypothetical protein